MVSTCGPSTPNRSTWTPINPSTTSSWASAIGSVCAMPPMTSTLFTCTGSFEITQVAGKPTTGVLKDVAMLGGYQSMDIDFLADQPGPSLFHCHQQLHMDYGFMA